MIHVLYEVSTKYVHVYYYHRQNHVIIETLHHDIRDLLQILNDNALYVAKLTKLNQTLDIKYVKSQVSFDITMLVVSKRSMIIHVPMFCIQMHN